ncbi:hypothetical protein KCV87_10015 [Actinosynnema pretiosum subsp. pretiosum]|uniref:Peptidase M41 domain-containing protein n=1 Tax=Actinosynnema pretiosum subsp. pretiosum TaxID=103721 RepID=A0AA45LAK2_9PSEU|nr:hypothetical protein APASM_2033 [Actinosynnema pretiosum subsp. pretiosum]QUF06356.1 hypothetical protein KCV87_10015 [Actinosynnema pretiosum subsp. pretiosum]
MDTPHLALTGTAHHEAGHAVIALALGGTVRGISLRPVGGDWHGDVSLRFPDTDQAVPDLVVALLAGAHAEHRWHALHRPTHTAYPYDIDAGAAPDRDLVHDLLAALPRRERPTQRELDARAARLVLTHWAHVEHLAARLVQHEHRDRTRS